MSLAVVCSRAACGIEAPTVTVETHLTPGMPRFSIVGLPETAVKESRDRVRSAIINSGFNFPIRRITVNLAPADLPKEGGRFDLAIAIGILAASKQIPATHLSHYEFAGELALTGQLRPIKGALPFALATKQHKRQLIIAADNAQEAALSNYHQCFAAHDLLTVCYHLNHQQTLTHIVAHPHQVSPHYPDLKDIKDQCAAKHALIIAAAGEHSMLLSGPPGVGKTMLATRLPGLLPPLEEQQALAVAAIYSISQHHFDEQRWRQRPFRSPHHTTSSVAMVGGGRPPSPGEISLAHHGILFLDELPEFNRTVLEALREPLEAGCITISRASYQVSFPAAFQLIAAMNPCPCGYWGDQGGRCCCSPEQVNRYRYKLSGPLIDRIDIHTTVPAVSPKALLQTQPNNCEQSAQARQRVQEAQSIQLKRQHKLNNQLDSHETITACQLTVADQHFLQSTLEKLQLSARSLHRTLRLSRTIADLNQQQQVTQQDIKQALAFRFIQHQ